MKYLAVTSVVLFFVVAGVTAQCSGCKSKFLFPFLKRFFFFCIKNFLILRDSQPMNRGYGRPGCSPIRTMWWYDRSVGFCRQMTFFGCGGNDNRCGVAVLFAREVVVIVDTKNDWTKDYDIRMKSC